VEAEGNWFDVKWKPGDPSRVYATKGRDWFANSQTDNGVRVSTDDGQTFSPLGTGQPSGASIAKTKIAVTAADPSVIYAHYVQNGTWSTLGIYRSTDNGDTWQVRNDSLNLTGGQGWYNNIIGVAASNADRVIAGGVHLYTSDDGGQTYTDLNSEVPFGDDVTPHWDNHALVLRPGLVNEFWIGTDGGVWRSTTDGATWQSRREGIVTYQFYDICVAQSDPDFTMGGTQDNGVPGRVGVDTWFESAVVADGFVCNIDPTNANLVISEWQFGNHLRSQNGGHSWTPIQNGIIGSGSWVTPVDQDQNDGSRLYTWASSGIYRTTNRGTLWENVSSHHARWISISPVDGDIIWTISHGPGVYHTTDDGGVWTRSFSFPTTGQETKILAHPTDPASAFATVGGYATGAPHILLTTDFGVSWSNVTGDFPDQPANTFIADPDAPDDWYVGSDTGVWKSTNAGGNWVPFGTGLPHAIVVDLEIRRSARKLVAGTYGRGVWEAEIPLSNTDAATEVARSRNLMLDPPRPNPVSDHAVLRFAARTGATVTLDIYDVGGRRVSRVADLATGDGMIRTVSWMTGDVPGGVYFAVLRAGEERISRKIVVQR
jgi:photosystem II stability/assembly factor-like uncharacterized protein